MNPRIAYLDNGRVGLYDPTGVLVSTWPTAHEARRQAAIMWPRSPMTDDTRPQPATLRRWWQRKDK